MNEDFMRQFQKMPDSILLEKIHVRLVGKERRHRIKQYFAHSVLMLIFVFGVLLIFSSAVRAEVLRTFQPYRSFTMCDLNSDIIYQDGWYCAKDGILTTDPSKYLTFGRCAVPLHLANHSTYIYPNELRTPRGCRIL